MPDERTEEPKGYGWSPELQRKGVALCFRDRGAWGLLGPQVFDARLISHAPLRPIAAAAYRACADGGGEPPSPELLEELVKEACAKLKPAVADAVRKEWQYVLTADLSDARAVRAKMAEWARDEALAQAVVKAAELVDRGAAHDRDGGGLLQVIQDALAVGRSSEACLRIVRQSRQALAELLVEEPKVSTGFDRVDRALEGGAAPGLYMVAGVPKIGKTAFLTQLDAEGARRGLTVWHVSGEMRMRPMIRRTVSSMTGFSKAQIKASPAKALDRVRSAYSQTGGEIIVEYAPGFTVDWMASRLRQLESQGERIGLVVADYIDLMRGREMTERRWELEEIGKRLRDLSVEVGIPFWTAKALNRKAVSKPIPTEADLAECFGLVYVVDALLVLCATEEEQQRVVVSPGGVAVEAPIIRIYFAVGREESDRRLLGAWDRNNDRQRWVYLPGYVEAQAQRAREGAA